MTQPVHAALILLALGGLGHAETLGITTFRIPEGFQRDPGAAGQVQLTHVDKAHGTYVRLLLYDAQPAASTADASFSREWQETAGVNFRAPLPSKVNRGKLRDGTPYLEASASGTGSSGPVRFTLRVFLPGRQAVSLMTVTGDKPIGAAMTAALSRFSEELRFAGQPGAGSQAAPSAVAVSGQSARPTELVGTWIRGSVSGPALYDRVSGAFKTYATGQGRYLELKADGQAHMTSLLTNGGGGGMSILTARDGTWTAQGGVLTLHFTSGTTEIKNFSSRKTRPGKLGAENLPYERYTFQGKPALSLSFGQSGKESLYQ